MGTVQTFRFLPVFWEKMVAAEMESSKALAGLALAWVRHHCIRKS